jgi:hypothetical protein
LIEAVRAFAGHGYQVAVVPPATRALLFWFDERSAHYEARQPRDEVRLPRVPEMTIIEGAT